MFKDIQTTRFFNLSTQRALYERVEGYVNKDENLIEVMDSQSRHEPELNLLRLDLGQNPDGCDPFLLDFAARTFSSKSGMQYCKDYPDLNWNPLIERISDLHGLPREWIILSAGLDQMLALIAATFFEFNDRYISATPSFYLFEEYSKRMGANSITLELKEEDNFDWSPRIFRNYESVLDKLHPKLLWIANPNNPTGRYLNLDELKTIISLAEEYYCFVVVDEAYGEYTDFGNRLNSASSLLNTYKNLIVLRTFSKAYGLANFRVGYAIARENRIIEALNLHRPYYPITGLSFEMACLALDHIEYLNSVRNRKNERFRFLEQELEQIGRYKWINTKTSTFMLSHKDLSAHELRYKLFRKGILCAVVPGDSKSSKEYIRLTIGTEEDNTKLITTLKEI